MSYWKNLCIAQKRKKRRKNSKRYKKSEKDRKQKKSKGESIHSLRNRGYRAYLASDHWKATAKRKRKLAGWKCENEDCPGDSRILEVHHLTYVRRGHERMGDLQVLCSSCHRELHRKNNAKI